MLTNCRVNFSESGPISSWIDTFSPSQVRGNLYPGPSEVAGTTIGESS